MKVQKVVWYDAISKKMPKDMIEILKKDKKLSGKKLLALNTTYGEVIELKDVYIVITEKSTDDDYEITIIPKDWVIK